MTNKQAPWSRAVKAHAKEYTKIDQDNPVLANKQTIRTAMRSYIRNIIPYQNTLPETVGKHIKEVGYALPGGHIKKIYDSLTKREAKTLVQLRTGMIRLNGYLGKTNAEESTACSYCGNKETVKYFIFHCPK